MTISSDASSNSIRALASALLTADGRDQQGVADHGQAECYGEHQEDGGPETHSTTLVSGSLGCWESDDAGPVL